MLKDRVSHMLPLSVLAFAIPSSVMAQVTESSTITNSYRYIVGGVSGSGTDSGGRTDIFRSVTTGTSVSEMGMSLTGTLDQQGSFFFLHNGVCVGNCFVSMTTNISFSLFNGGTAPVDLRFDSQITPGHLANSFLNPLSNAQATFNFIVSQDPGLRQGILFESDGNAKLTPPDVENSDGSIFNGFTVNDNAPDWSVADWSATNLSVVLATLAPGQTTNLFYTSTLTIGTTDPNCPDPTLCESYQVAFGDPRNAGGVLEAAALMSLADFGAAASPLVSPFNTGQSPAVGAQFDPFRVTYRFVPVGSPLPGPQPVTPPITYDVNYRSLSLGAVPEPATWLFMVLGFGLVGAGMRRARAAEPAFARLAA